MWLIKFESIILVDWFSIWGMFSLEQMDLQCKWIHMQAEVLQAFHFSLFPFAENNLIYSYKIELYK